MQEKESSEKKALPPDPFLRRWSFFFVYLLLFPLFLELLFGAFSFSGTEWLNWFGSLLFRSALGALFIFAAQKSPSQLAPAVMGTVCAAAGIFNLLDIFLLVNFATVFDYSIFHLMRIAPQSEIRGFFQLFLQSSSTWVILLLYPAAGFIIFKIKKYKLLWGALLLLSAGAMFFLNSVAKESRSPLLSPAARMKKFVQGWQNTRRKIQLDLQAEKISASSAGGESLCLLIIGESHSRRRSSLYGFSRETTPELKKLYRQKTLYRFDDAVTPHVMTHLVLPGLLTSAGSDGENFQNYPALPDIFRKASFKTWYIYNQMPDEESALPFLAAAKRSDHFISFSNPRKRYDHEILELLKKIFASPGAEKLVILHLRGSHWKYAENFPETMRRFSRIPKKTAKERIIDEYDDSLRALDHFLAQVIQLLEKEQKNGFLLYLSDHGESLYEEENFVGHTDLFPTAATAEIPMFLWLPENFARPEIRAAVKSALQKPFLSSDLPHLLMELAGIKTAVFRPERSLINPQYRPLPRYVSTRQVDYSTMKNRTKPISKPQ